MYARVIVVARRVSYLDVTDNRHVDGHDYMYALSEILDSAREAIFILVSLSNRVETVSLMSHLIIGLVAYT